MENNPEIIYFQTVTDCNGHCRYCPHDDVYSESPRREMKLEMFTAAIRQLVTWDYKGRIGFLLHYEPTLDKRLVYFVDIIRRFLPDVTIEIATNGSNPDAPVLKLVDVVDMIPAHSRTWATTRAGNARACAENAEKCNFGTPCTLPANTLCIAANGDVLLCCQDWRHEAVVGTVNDLAAARKKMLDLNLSELEICKDCMAGKTAEEVGGRLGHRAIK